MLLGLYLALHIQLQMHMCEDLRVALLVDMNAALLYACLCRSVYLAD